MEVLCARVRAYFLFYVVQFLVTLQKKKVEQHINMCRPLATIIPARQSICTGLKADVFSSKLLSQELCFISLDSLLCNVSMQNSEI